MTDQLHHSPSHDHPVRWTFDGQLQGFISAHTLLVRLWRHPTIRRAEHRVAQLLDGLALEIGPDRYEVER
jgi:hypothetical protein